eukprot:GHVS01097025.1.p1 GENE.GHVS01097025.1~~GHVS01097025.1.p1  ORF type:complete len:159 (-),score=11.19 GHVS01097025.1:17-493(-)
MDEVEERADNELETRLWETSLIVSTMPHTVSTELKYFNVCHLDFWVDSLSCILEMLLSTFCKDNICKAIVEWVIFRIGELRQDDIFYQAWKKVGKKEKEYRRALGEAFAMHFLYGWWPPQTDVVVSSGAKNELTAKLEDLESHNDYGKLELVNIIELV